jgi:hypothetical protein
MFIYKNNHKKIFSFILLFIIFLIPIFVSFFFKFNESISPVYLLHAKEFAISGSIKSNFFPIGYTAILLPGYLLAGITGILITQAIFYIVAIFIIVSFLVKDLKYPLENFYILLLSTIVFHPYILKNIISINDNAVSILFIAVYSVWIFKDRASILSTKNAIAIGLTTGLWITIRPNIVLITLLPIYLIYNELNNSMAKTLSGKFYYIFKSKKNYLIYILIFFLSIFIAFATVNLLLKNKIIYWPEYGFYTLFVGNNPYSIDFYLKYLDGEQSIPLAFKHYNQTEALLLNDFYNFNPNKYLMLVLKFFIENPVQAIATFFIKFYVFFGPNLVLATTLLKKIIQVLLISPFFIWVYFIYRVSINNNSFKKILIPIIFVTLYIIPFLITNSTPRYRMPILDVFFILHVIYIYKNKKFFRIN